MEPGATSMQALDRCDIVPAKFHLFPGSCRNRDLEQYATLSNPVNETAHRLRTCAETPQPRINCPIPKERKCRQPEPAITAVGLSLLTVERLVLKVISLARTVHTVMHIVSFAATR